MCSTNLLGSKKRDFSFGIVGITDQFDDRRQTIQTLESIFDMMALQVGNTQKLSLETMLYAIATVQSLGLCHTF